MAYKHDPLVRGDGYVNRTDGYWLRKVERGLTHVDPRHRILWGRCAYYTPTRKQVERGLADPDPYVRLAWAERMDWNPTPEQIRNGLLDEHVTVRSAWVARVKYNLDVALESVDVFSAPSL